MRRLATAVFRKAVLCGRVPAPVNNVMLAAGSAGARGVARIAGGVGLLELGNILDAVRYFATYRFDTPSLAACNEYLAAFGNPAHAARTLSLNEPTFEALWALEGLGYRSAQRALRESSRRAVDLGVAVRLPIRLQGIFRVGVTVVLAEDCLGYAVKEGTVGWREAVRSYFQVCDERSPERLRGIEVESLGFVAATLFPGALRHAHDTVSRYDQRLSPLFWHGVGRGLYVQYPPALSEMGRSWPLLRSVLNSSPDASDEVAVLEGYGWALGLVNLRQPSVVRRRADTFASPGGEMDQLACGLREACLCWLRWKGWDGNDGSIKRFAPTEPQQAEDWHDLVSTLLSPLETNAASLAGRTYGEMLVPADSTGELK